MVWRKSIDKILFLLKINLVPPVDAPCNTDEDCGTNKVCIGKLCACATGNVVVDTTDAFGRVIQGCTSAKVNGNIIFINIIFLWNYLFLGVDQKRFSPVLFLFFILARIFFV